MTPAPRDDIEPEDVVQMFIDAIQVDHLTDEQVEMLLDIFDTD